MKIEKVFQGVEEKVYGIPTILQGIGSKVKEITQFIRESPILSGTAITGTAIGGGLLIAQQIRKRKKSKSKTKRSKKSVSKRRISRRRRRYGRRGIIRGRGLGRSEIKHTRKGVKLVSFTTKDGKRVRFRVRGTSTRRKGYIKKRKRR